MFGLFLALVIFMWKFVISSFTMEMSFIGAAGFLYYWYLTLGIVTMIIVGALALIPIIFGAVGGGAVGGKIGVALGLIAGGATSGFFVLVTLARRVLQVFGAWLLLTAGQPNMSFSDFDIKKLVAGAIILFITIVLMRKKK